MDVMTLGVCSSSVRKESAGGGLGFMSGSGLVCDSAANWDTNLLDALWSKLVRVCFSVLT